MDEKKYQIFISSTYTDLVKEREKVIETLLGIYHLPIGMEMFSAGNEEQWEIIKDTIKSSDYYILILGHRYGSVTEEGISYTEKEYDYALEIKKPIISFIKYRDEPTTPNQRESDSEKIEKLKLFHEKVMKNKMCDFWKNADELASKVAIALPKAFSRYPQIGWVRGNQRASSEILEELAALSKKNRELLEENKLLKEKTPKRLPKLTLLINDSSDKFTYLINKKSNAHPKIENNITLENIEPTLRAYIGEEEINDYNKSMPSESTLEHYKLDSYFYDLLHIENSQSQLKLTLENSGSLKANEIRVYIKFPPELQVISKSEINEIKRPEIKLPIHPILIAKNRKKAQEETEYRKFSSLFENNDLFSSGDITSRAVLLPQKSHNIRALDKNVWTSLDNNTITLYRSNLMHTLVYHFYDEYVVLPKTEGNFFIDISIICEELEEAIKYSIPASVCQSSN